MKNLIKKQEEEFGEKIDKALDIVSLKDEIMTIQDTEDGTIVKIRFKAVAKKYLKQILDKVRKETAEKVCDRMMGKILLDDSNLSWNDRILEAERIKQQILKELE